MQHQQHKIPVYKLGTGFSLGADGQPFKGWPYSVAYAPDCERGEFFMEEGDTRNGNGNFFHPEQILKPLWQSHLEAAGVLWLVPILERMARGEDVPCREILEEYQRVHGNKPESDEIVMYCE